ncbi:EpsG family protein [Arcticibacter sp.]|uniref:EpsG family protein n=1 Tax=Arcticibacter sp. TaxID=1872630 RepID=UPI00388FFA7E
MLLGGLVMLLFMILGTIKWETGTDWLNYHDFFTDKATWDEFNNGDFELGYTALSYIIRGISGSYTLFLSVFIFLVLIFKFLFFCSTRFLPHLLITLLLYYSFFIGDVFATRQALAISITLYSTKYILSRQLPLFVLTVYIACLFHVTALIFLPAYFLYSFTFSRKTLLFGLASSALLGFVLSSLPIASMISQALALQGRLGERLDIYSVLSDQGDDPTGSSIDPKVSYILALSRRVVIILPIVVVLNQLRARFPHSNVLVNIVVFGNMLYLILTPILPVMKRATAYYDAYELILLPSLVLLPKSRWMQYLIWLVITIYSLSKLTSVLLHFWDLYTPFNTIFDSPINRNLR